MTTDDLPHFDERLGFLPEYVDPILDGRKTATVRATDTVEAGQRVLAHVKGRPFAVLKVTRVLPVTLDTLTASHARWLNQPDVETLRRDVAAIYPQARKGADLYLFRFHLVTTLRRA